MLKANIEHMLHFELDKHGRAIISDKEILEMVNGAVIAEATYPLEDNSGCGGSNVGCANESCG